MAGKQILAGQLDEAVKAYCMAEGKQSSQSEEKPNKITIFAGSPNPGDPMLWLEDGLFRCSDSEFGLRFAEEYLSGPTKATTPQKSNLPAKARNGNGVTLATPGDLFSLTVQDIINYINPKATEQEAYLFLEFCKKKHADPMKKQIYLVVYENDKGRNVSFITGKEYFTEKAEVHPQFDGLQAGIIVRPKDGGDLVHREGTFYLPSEETLLGGWAEVHRKDRKIPSKSEVLLGEYNTGKSQWTKMPATMIRKVAIVQSLREAFPVDLGGMYDSSEMNQAGVYIDPEKEIAEAA